MSDEAQMAQYFFALDKLNEEDAVATAQYSKELELGMREAIDGKGSETIERALSKLRPFYTKYQRNLIALSPPSRLQAFHKNLVLLSADASSLFESLVIAARTKDKEKVMAEFRKFGTVVEETKTSLEKAMRDAGFSNKREMDRALNQGLKKPLGWFWALTILAFGAMLLTGFLQFIGVLLLLPAMGFLAGGFSLWKKRVYFGAVFSVAISFCIVIFVCTMIGASMAAIAERMMFPRTELSSWFIYLVGGLMSATLYTSGERNSANHYAPGERIQESSSSLLGCVAPLLCLSGYIWAAIAQGTLFGPWSWIVTTVKNFF